MKIVKCFFPDCDRIVVGEIVNRKKEKYYICSYHLDLVDMVKELDRKDWFVALNPLQENKTK